MEQKGKPPDVQSSVFCIKLQSRNKDWKEKEFSPSKQESFQNKGMGGQREGHFERHLVGASRKERPRQAGRITCHGFRGLLKER